MGNRLYINPTDWQSGDVITADKMNKIEQGLVDIAQEVVDAAGKHDDQTSMTLQERLDLISQTHLDEKDHTALEINTIKNNINYINEDIAAINQNIDEKNSAIQEHLGLIDQTHADDIQQANIEINSIKNNISYIDQDISDIKTDINENNSAIQENLDLINEKHTNDLRQANIKINSLINSVEDIDQTIDDIRTDIADINSDISDINQEVTNLNEKNRNIRIELTRQNNEIVSNREEATSAITVIRNKVNSQDSTIEERHIEYQAEFNEIKNTLKEKSDNLYYDKENNLLYLTSDGEIISDGIAVAGSGGGGGGGGGGTGENNAVLSLRNISGWASKTISKNEKCDILFNWSSIEENIPTGDGSLQISISSVQKAVIPIQQGDVTVDVSPYLNDGTNTLILMVTDIYGNRRSIRFSVTKINLQITSNFDASFPFTGDIDFSFTASANVVKTIYILIDDNEIDTIITSSTNQRSYVIPKQSHGAHILKCYYEADINGQTIRSNELYYNITCIEENAVTPVITSSFNKSEVNQYDTLNIEFSVFNPVASTTKVTIKANGIIISEPTVDQSTTSVTYRATQPGTLTIEISTGTYGESDYAIKTITTNVIAQDITVNAETSNLALYLSAAGRNNGETNRDQWIYETISSQLTGFNWRINGWTIDEEGVSVLRVSDDARVTIPYKIFENDFKTNGKTIEIEFSTREILNYQSTILSCLSNNIGLRITPQMVYFSGAQTTLTAPYKENEHMRLSIVVNKQTEYRLIQIYIDGIMSAAIQYASGERFSQTSPVNITIGSDDCTIDIYNIRVYDAPLSSRQIVNNWIADTQIGSLMIDRYKHNNIYDPDTNDITPATIPNDLPYFILEASELPQFKGDVKVISGSYHDNISPSKEFTFDGCEINVQGTSSAIYYRKNYDLKFKNGFITRNGKIDKYGIKTDSIPFNRFVLKADVASSESTNNTGLTQFYNDTCPYKTPEMIENPKIRWGIEGIPIAVFWYNPEDGHTEFIGKYNFNLPKRAPDPLGYSGDMESWEWERNNSANVKFQDVDFTSVSYDTANEKYYPTWYDDFEARFPSDTWRDTSKLGEFLSWVKSTWREEATNNNLSSNVTYRVPGTTTIDNYSNDNSYSVAVEKEDGKDTGYRLITFTKDTPAYRLTKFRAEFDDYGEIESFTYYYLFTLAWLMIDSRAKNMFIGFNGGDVNKPNRAMDRKATCQPYDMDTALGTNNSGVLMFGYSYEDTDTVSDIITGSGTTGTQAPVYNAQDSVLWVNFRDAFKPEIRTMYTNLRTINKANGWDYKAIEQMYEDHQSKWPEALFNEDSYIKYIYPLTNPVTVNEETGELIRTDRYLTMLQGSKKQQRKWWLYNRLRYLDSKYSTGDAYNNILNIRFFNSGTMTLTPAIDMYVGVSFGGGTTPDLKRTTANTPVSFTYTNTSGSTTEMETWIYSGDMISEIGGLSSFYPNEVDVSKGTKLKSLKIGDSASGYSNANLRKINVQNCILLENIDCRNCPNLNISVNLEGSPRLKEAYFEGTSITGVDLVDGCSIEKLHLPSTITALTLINLNKLTDLVVPSFANISRLMLENISSDVVDPINMLNELQENTQVNIKGLEITAESVDDIDSLITLLDKFKGVNRQLGVNSEWVYQELENAQITGVVHIDTIPGNKIAEYNAKYPYLVIDAAHTNSKLYYYNYNGTELITTEDVNDGGNGSYTGQPSRASTAQYNYTFVGWSKSTNQTRADSDALTRVIADRNVYAAYSTTTRKYAVTFKNDDGSILQPATYFEYNSTPQYNGDTPVSTNEGMGAWTGGWIPPLTKVTGTATYTAQYFDPVENVEITDDWDTILSNIENGTYSTVYKIGNYKSFDFGYKYSPGSPTAKNIIKMQIAAFNKDIDENGNTIPITWVAKNLISSIYSTTLTFSSNSGEGIVPWPNTKIRKILNNEMALNAPGSSLSSFYEVINDKNVLKHIKPAYKTYVQAYSGNDSQNRITKYSYDKFWIPSLREINYITGIEETTGCIYKEIFKSNNDRNKDENGNAQWAVRTQGAYNSYYAWDNMSNTVRTIRPGQTYNLVIPSLIGFCLGPDTIHDSWEQISAHITAGDYATVYSIGDTKCVDLGDQGVIVMQIAAFDADVDEDGNTIPITWIAKTELASPRVMNNSRTNSGGYPATTLNTYVNNLKFNLPHILQSMIVPTVKTSQDYNNGNVRDITSTFELWIPSEREITGYGEKSGVVYSDLFINEASRRKRPYGHNGTGNEFYQGYWLRSAITTHIEYFHTISNDGKVFSVTADFPYTEVVIGFCTGKSSIISDSWEDISANIVNGTYSTKYAIGDIKSVDLGNEGIIDMQIAAFDADVDENENTIPITWVAKQALATAHGMNNTNTTTGGYPASTMKTYIDGLESRMPATLKSMIKAAVKTSRDYNGGTKQDLSTAMRLWIPSYREIFGGIAYEQTGPIYSVLFKDAASRIKKIYGGTANIWWLRSAYSANIYWEVDSSGNGKDMHSAKSAYGVVLGFCTGVATT